MMGKRKAWLIAAFVGVIGIAVLMGTLLLSPAKSEEPLTKAGETGVAAAELQTEQENCEAAPEKLEKSTTSEGFLKSVIPLFSNERDRLERNGGRIEHWEFENGQWVLVMWYSPEDQIEIRVHPIVTFDEASEQFSYQYNLAIDPSSEQSLSVFGFDLETMEGFDIPFPYEFADVSASTGFFFNNMSRSNLWYWRSEIVMPPRLGEAAFSFKTTHPPGVVNCFAAGWNDKRAWVIKDREGEDRFFPSWWEQGVKGRTVGPVPEELDCEFLAQRIVSYLNVSVVEGWISESVAEYLRRQLNGYLESVPNGNFEEARSRLDQSLEFLKNAASPEISSEGRMLYVQNLLLLRRLT